METSNHSDEFKRDAVLQITVRGCPVREVPWRLGVSTYSRCNWLKLFGEPVPKPGADQEAENRRLKREPARVTEATSKKGRVQCPPLMVWRAVRSHNASEMASMKPKAGIQACASRHAGCPLPARKAVQEIGNQFQTIAAQVAIRRDRKKAVDGTLHVLVPD